MTLLEVYTDFAGGNAIIERIDGDDIYFRPDLRDTEGHWFYWCLGLRGGAGRTLRFHLTSPNTLAAMGPAVSFDQGMTWAWLGPDCVRDDDSFEFTVPHDAGDVRLSMAMTYTHAHWDTFASRHAGNPLMRVDELCRSRQGRSVQRVLLGRADAQSRYRVVLTARHHCCESMASYTLEGILDSVLADDELGRWFRDHVRIMAVPFVDPDGVEAGDQGKNRRPRDHNRDYAGAAIYPETAALREVVPRWIEGGPAITLDLHCPWIRGPMHEKVYFVGSRNPDTWHEQCRFGECLEAARTGPIPYAAADNLPFGQDWNVGTSYSKGMGSSRWASQLPGVMFSVGVEVPYAIAHGCEVNQTTARALGRDLAHAIADYLQKSS